MWKRSPAPAASAASSSRRTPRNSGSEAESADGEFFDHKGFRETLSANAGLGCVEFHAKLVEAAEDFSEGAELSDDITTLVLEYRP